MPLSGGEPPTYKAASSLLTWAALSKPRISLMYPLSALIGLFLSSGALTGSSLLGIGSILLVAAGVYMLNDVFDVDIDSISNPQRPLVRRDISPSRVLKVSLLCILIGVLSLSLFSLQSSLMMGFFGLLGIVYSAPPVRLRRYFLLPYLIIGCGVLFSFLAGVGLGDSSVLETKYVIGALLLFAFFVGGSTAKDFRDVEGDVKAGVRTIATVLPKALAARISAVCYLCSFGFVAFFAYAFGMHYAVIIGILTMFAIGLLVWRNMLAGIDNEGVVRSSYVRLAGLFLTCLLFLVFGSLVVRI